MNSIYSSVWKLCFQIRIWARKTAIDQGQGNYALNVTGAILDFYKLYYNISYPLNKSGELHELMMTTVLLMKYYAALFTKWQSPRKTHQLYHLVYMVASCELHWLDFSLSFFDQH